MIKQLFSVQLFKAAAIACLLMLPSSLLAQLNWQLQIGGMYREPIDRIEGDGEFYYGSNIEAFAGLLMQIPIKDKYYIETGLGYHAKPCLFQADDFKFNKKDYYEAWVEGREREYEDNFSTETGQFLEIPIKFGYRLKLNDKNQFNFGIGPYLSAVCVVPSRSWGNEFTVGLNISAAFRHRCMSYGFTYQNPLFYNGPRDYFKNSILFTIGINWGNKAWKHIGTGALIAGAVAGGVGAAYVATHGGNDYNSSSYSSGSGDSSSSGSNAENMYYHWEKRAKSAYDSLNGHSGGTTTYQANKKLLRDAQKQMRDWRSKAAKAGVTIRKSFYEDCDVSIR